MALARRVAAVLAVVLACLGCTVDGEVVALPLPGAAGPMIVARDIAFDPATLTVPAGAAFTVTLDNQDDGVPHGIAVDIAGGNGATPMAASEVVIGIAPTTLPVPPLVPGRYRFFCPVHPNMAVDVTAEG
jgi:plastocyanin